MAKDLSDQLSRLGHKAELLATRYATLRAENERLRNEIMDLQSTVKALETSNEKLRLEVEHLQISSAIAPDGESVRQTRVVISNLVREIDACIADLMGDV